VLIGLLIVTLDLAVISGLIVAIVVTGLRLRPTPSDQPRVAMFRRWMTLTALVAALGLVVAGNARLLISGYEQGRPAPSQVAGTWTDREGATPQVMLDGRFTAAGLPADASDPAGDGKSHPADGHGKWQIAREDGAWRAVFTLSGGSQFEFNLESSASPGDASTAMFSYIFPQYNAVDLWTFHRQ
jgi:hypothetical protein